MTTLCPPATEDVLSTYQDQGYLLLHDLFSSARIDAINARLSQIARESDASGHHALPGVVLEFEPGSDVSTASGHDRELRIRKFRDFGQADPFFWDHLRDPLLQTVVKTLIGPDPLLMQSMAMVKPPGIGSAKDWHQDIAYFPLTPARAIGVWIACDDADLENGCMQVMPGSHRLGLHPHEMGPTGWRIAYPLVAERTNTILPLPMTKGSALFFDAGLWHFTDHNRSARRRRAVQYHFVGKETQIADQRKLWSLAGSRPPLAL